MNNRIIVIDDEESILNDYQMILSPPQEDISKQREMQALEAELFGASEVQERNVQEHYEVTAALQGKEGADYIAEAKKNGKPFAVAFIDIRMPPGWDGVHTAKKIREIDSDIEIVMVTAYSDRDRREIVTEVSRPEKLLYIKKPFDPDEIRQLALCLTRKWELEQKAMRHRNYLERLLDSVRRLKTLNISSVRDVLAAILNEVLCFVHARKGFIARLENGKVCMEINSENLSVAEIGLLIKNVSEQLSDIHTISWVDNIMIFPLQNGFGNFFILVSDLQPPVHEEKFELLRLLLGTSSEVLDSVSRHERFLKNERIATIGQMAAGIIHEINNPLTAMLGAADFYKSDGDKLWKLVRGYADILRNPDLPPELIKNAEELCRGLDPEKIRRKMKEHHIIIRDGVERVRVLMKNIRTFSSGSNHFEAKLQDISEALENTLMLAHNTIKYGITVYKDWESPLLARCDLDSIRQVFLNLILNAAQAMDGHGELRISAIRKDRKVIVSVADTGPGIPESEMKRIFEAFYTTKPDGTGLGLSIVKGIVDRHSGTIRVESEPGKGTIFHVEIPGE